MLGIESSEATFLLRQLLLRVQELHMNSVARVFVNLGQLGQRSHNFERTLYMPFSAPRMDGDSPLVQGHAARTLFQLDLKAGKQKQPRQTWQPTGAAWADGRLHPSDRKTLPLRLGENVQFEPGQNALSTLLIEQAQRDA
jgi:hypothetical protein